MFGFSWAEIALIMAVALVAIGPKDLPVAIRTVTTMMKKARGMAAEFQGHVDEMMREANLAEVKTEINKLRRFDFKGAAERTIDPDGTLREATKAPVVIKPPSVRTVVEVVPPAAVAAASSPAVALATAPVIPVVAAAEAAPVDAPAFIPPDAARKPPVPDFIPPGIRRWSH